MEEMVPRKRIWSMKHLPLILPFQVRADLKVLEFLETDQPLMVHIIVDMNAQEGIPPASLIQSINCRTLSTKKINKRELRNFLRNHRREKSLIASS